MKCRNCRHLYKDWCAHKLDSPDPDLDRECKDYMQATHADRIRSMSDEKLASEMTQRSISTICDIVCQGGCEAIATLNKTGGEVCKEIIMKWLQQPAEEEDT